MLRSVLDPEAKKILAKKRNSKYQRIALTDEAVTFLETFLETPAKQIDLNKVSNLDQWIKDRKFVKVWFKNAFDDVSDDKFQTFLKYSANQLQDHWAKEEGRAQIVSKIIFLGPTGLGQAVGLSGVWLDLGFGWTRVSARPGVQLEQGFG